MDITLGHKVLFPESLTGLLLLGPAIVENLRLRDPKLTKLAVLQNALTQWCTSWRCQPRACVRTQGVNLRGIMYLFIDVVVGVQASHEELLQKTAAHSFFGGSYSCNHNTPHYEMAAALLVLRRLFLSVGGK